VDEYFLDDEGELDDMLEGYCVRCRESVVMENPQAVWTRRGMPATRGECSLCGGTVFRMGKTAAHDQQRRPAAVEIAGSGRGKQPKLHRDTVYIVYAQDDAATARQLADDLARIGIATWLHEHDSSAGEVAWAGGVHPALAECSRMIYILSPAALEDGQIGDAWRFFRSKRKPIVIAQIAPAQPPDDIRRSPRFDLGGNYRGAFRELVQALS
jgi:hypothetical protein